MRKKVGAKLAEAEALLEEGDLPACWDRLEALDGPKLAKAAVETVAQLRLLCAGRLADNANRAGDYAAAAQWRRVAVKLAPQDHDLGLRFARALLKDGSPQEAWEALRTAADAAPDDEETRALRLHCARRLADDARKAGRLKDAARWFGIAAAMAPDDVRTRLRWGQSLLIAQQAAEAWEVLCWCDDRELGIAATEKLGCARRLGDAALREGRPEDVERWRGIAAAMAPANAELQLQWGAALIAVGRLTEAWAVLERCVGHLPDRKALVAARVVCARKLADAAYDEGRYADVADWRGIAASLAPEDEQLRRRWGQALTAAGRPREAWEVLGQCEGQGPEGEALRRARINSAYRLAVAGEYHSGVDSIEGVDWDEVAFFRGFAARHQPDNAWAQILHVTALLYGRRFNEAADVLRGVPDNEIGAKVREEIGCSVKALKAQVGASDFLYRAHAPRYLERGLPVIPVFGKRPVPTAWHKWSTEMPPSEDIQRWMEVSWAGIGLVIGPQAGVVIMDIDARDPAVATAIEQALPPSPWRRVGRYGAALAYRWSEVTPLIGRDENRDPLYDLLGRERMVVLPPSVHPGNGVPYAANTHLVDVLEALPLLPADYDERIAFALRPLGVTPATSPPFPWRAALPEQAAEA